jgi:competence protein ComEC
VYHNNENSSDTAALARPFFGWVARGMAAFRDGAVGAILAERDRWALWLPAGMGAGVGLYFTSATEPVGWMGAGLIIASMAVWLGFRKSAWGLILGFALAAPAVGFTAGQIRTHVVSAPVIEREIGPVQVQGRIVVAEMRPSDRRLTLDDLTIGDLGPLDTPHRVRVTVRARGGEVAPGDVVTLRAVLLPPSSPASPGAFDFARYAWFHRLGAVGYAVSAPEVVEGGEPGARGSLAAFRHTMSQRISAKLEGQQGAVAAALMNWGTAAPLTTTCGRRCAILDWRICWPYRGCMLA